MSNKSLAELASTMRGIDIAILATHAGHDHITARPMSNNGDVDYDGVSYYFTYEDTECVSDIQRHANVALGFTGQDRVYVAVTGAAELIRDKAAFKTHWRPGLDHWFAHGVDTPGIVLIKVTAKRIKLWVGTEETEIVM